MKFQVFFQLQDGPPCRATRTAPTIHFLATTSFLAKIPVLFLFKKEYCTTLRDQQFDRQDKHALVSQRNSTAETRFIKRNPKENLIL